MKRAAPPPPVLPAPLLWAQRHLPHYFTDPPCPFHAELMADLADPPRRLIARVAPRGHAKSTIAAFAYPLWCICTQRRRNIVIITHESALATQFVRDIRHELESNDSLLAEYGDLCTPPPAAPAPARRSRPRWRQSLFTTHTGVTVQSKGVGASLRGTRVGPQRPDLIICDDLEKDTLVHSPDQRRRLEHWLRRVVLPALAPDGQLLVLGSLLHFDGLLANLANRRAWPRWDHKVYRAIEAVHRPAGQWSRTPLWPSRWPLTRLDEERQRIGTLAFEHEYQANPVDNSIRVFRPEWLRRWSNPELEHIRPRLLNLLAIDPATGSQCGDFFALWAGGLDPETGRIYTYRLTLERIGVVAQVRRILAAAEHWQPVRIGIETTAYQIALKDILEEESRRLGLLLPIVALRTLTNKRARIEGTAPLYENGTLRLPPDLSPEAEQQFLHFPQARHDDAPDVCAMAVELARTLRRGRWLELATNPPPTPPTPW